MAVIANNQGHACRHHAAMLTQVSAFCKLSKADLLLGISTFVCLAV